MIEPAPKSSVAKIILAIDRFNATSSNGRSWGGRRFDCSTTYRTERFVQAGSQVLTLGRLVNPREQLDILLVLSWEFGADGRIAGVDFYSSEPEALTALEASASV